VTTARSSASIVVEFKQTCSRSRDRLRRFASTLLLLLVCTASVALAQVEGPTDSQLADITARGRALAAYDFAAWHGTDAVTALKPIPGTVTRYIARETPKGWAVAFGRLTASRDTFLIAYEAVRTSTIGEFEGFTGVSHATPVADTGYFVRAARAIDTATIEFGPVRRSYNVAALPAPSGNWCVYLVPAPTITGLCPLGADARLLISADGRTILERRRLHISVIEFSASRVHKPAGSTMEASMHTALIAEIPEDTDVYHVLSRTPKVPEYVVTKHLIYRIDTDGKIIFFGTH
jgi:hypothetical protein